MQVNITNVTFPKPGGKYGSLRLADGNRIAVPANLVGQFRGGTVVDVPTKVEVWYRGSDKEQQVTVATGGPGGSPTGAVGGQQGYQSFHGTPDRNTGQRANTGFVPRVYQGGGGTPSGPDQARQIFVTGTVGRAMGSGKFAASELPVLTQAACEAYDKVLSAPAKPSPQLSAEPPEPEQGDPGPAELL